MAAVKNPHVAQTFVTVLTVVDLTVIYAEVEPVMTNVVAKICKYLKILHFLLFL